MMQSGMPEGVLKVLESSGLLAFARNFGSYGGASSHRVGSSKQRFAPFH